MTKPDTPRPQTLPKRFYKEVDYRAEGDFFRLTLDGKPLSTPAKRPLLTASHEHAIALVNEWASQKDVIDPFSMPHNRLYNSILDRLLDYPAEAKTALISLSERDQLFCFAEDPDALYKKQREAWLPVYDWVEATLGIRPTAGQGLALPVQNETFFQALDLYLTPLPLATLGALQELSNLTDSLLLAMHHIFSLKDIKSTWDAAHVDEDFQISQWGIDEDAEARRLFRFGEAVAASEALNFFETNRDKQNQLEIYLQRLYSQDN